MIKRYYSMFNCNQNNHSFQKSIKYYLWLRRQQQTNNISISISFGFQNFSENSCFCLCKAKQQALKCINDLT
jgi:hypothetical protein